MRTLKQLLVLLSLVLAPAASSASIVQVSGTIDSVYPGISSIVVGDIFTATLLVDDSAVDSDPGNFFVYSGAVSIDIAIGANSWSTTGGY